MDLPMTSQHVGNMVLHYVILPTTSPTYPFQILFIPTIKLLLFPPMTFLFNPPPQSFTCRADLTRLGSAFSTLAGGPGAVMSDSFASNCLSVEVIFSI